MQKEIKQAIKEEIHQHHTVPNERRVSDRADGLVLFLCCDCEHLKKDYDEMNNEFQCCDKWHFTDIGDVNGGLSVCDDYSKQNDTDEALEKGES